MPSLRTSGIFAISLGLLTLCAAGCDEPEGRPLPWSGLQSGMQDDGDVVLADRAFLVESEPGAEMYVGDEELVFYGSTATVDDDWQPGDVLVNGAGVGFVRHVIDVEQAGGDTVVTTELGELHDVVVRGGLQGEFRPFSQASLLPADEEIADFVARMDAQGGPVGLGDLADGPHVARGPEVDGGYVKLANTKLLSNGDLSLDVTDGHFSFDPSLMIDLEVGLSEIRRFEIAATGLMDAELELTLSAEGLHKVSNKVVKLWESPRHAWYGFIGPVPVVVVTQLELGADVSVSTDGPASVTVGAGASSWVEVGAVYDEGDWTLIGEQGFTFRYSGPEFVFDNAMSAKVALDGKLKVKLYDVVGPYLGIKPYAKVGVEGLHGMRSWFADIGVEGKIGGAVSLPGKKEIGIEGTLFDWSHPLAQGSF